MNAVPFDTLKFAQRLEAAGMATPLVAGTVEALADAMSGAELATKADLRESRAATQSDLKGFRTATTRELMDFQAATGSELKELSSHMNAKFGQIDARFEQMDVKLELLRRDMTIRLGGMLVIGIGVIVTSLRLVPMH
jgi:hypothetical protein